LAVLMLWGTAFALGCFVVPNDPADDLGGGVMAQLFTSSRGVLAEKFYLTADTYFHRGVGHHKEQAFTSWLESLHDNVRPESHEHAEGEEIAEIMPWLYFAAETDPDNVETVLVTAYWLSRNLNRPDEALALVNEALRRHPDDYELYAERARIYMMKHNAVKAANNLDHAIMLWPSDENPDDEGARLNLAQILSYRGFLWQIEGNADEAIRVYERAYAMFPEHDGLRMRLKRLRRGELRMSWARDTWQALFAEPHDDHDEHDDHGGIGDRH
jgi:tetratricopeptide (TPR) repeat protein